MERSLSDTEAIIRAISMLARTAADEAIAAQAKGLDQEVKRSASGTPDPDQSQPDPSLEDVDHREPPREPSPVEPVEMATPQTTVEPPAGPPPTQAEPAESGGAEPEAEPELPTTTPEIDDLEKDLAAMLAEGAEPGAESGAEEAEEDDDWPLSELDGDEATVMLLEQAAGDFLLPPTGGDGAPGDSPAAAATSADDAADPVGETAPATPPMPADADPPETDALAPGEPPVKGPDAGPAPPGDPVRAGAREQASPDEAPLDEIDEAIAGEVESLLHGDYESVEEVLKGPPDEQAVRPDEPERSTGSDDLDGEGDHGWAQEQASPPSATLGDDAADAPSAEPPVVPDEPEPSAFEPPDAPADASSPAQEPAAVAGPDDPAQQMGPAATAPPASDPASETDAEIETVAAAPPSAGRPAPTADRKRKAGKSSMWSAAEPRVIRALERVNYPIRFLPHSARAVIDWIALSLIFWVPIVWLIALLVVGR
ncbi:MAG: hypothetical protein ACYS0G_06065 [Planctomycetota bacterium]